MTTTDEAIIRRNATIAFRKTVNTGWQSEMADDYRSNRNAVTNGSAGEPTEDNGGSLLLRLDARRGSTAMERRHRAFILEALVRFRVAVQKIVDRVSGDQLITPTVESEYLVDRFTDMSKRIDGYMAQMIDSRRPPDKSTSFTSLYAGMFQLETQYNADLRKYSGVLVTTKSGQQSSSGQPLCGFMNFMSFLCSNNNNN